jgi:hypothetical protein
MLPAVIGKQQFKVSPDAKKVLLSRSGSGWDIQEIATLGESDVFIRRDGNNALSLIHKSVRLSADRKEIARLGNKDDSPWVITVPGYNKLNQIAGVYIITPESIVVAGVEHSNPFVEYIEGEIKRVIVRKIAIGYSPIGNLVAVDTVRHYNFDAYYLQDLHAKAKYKPESAKFGTVFLCPFAPDEEVEEKNGRSYVRANGRVYVFKPIKDVEGIWIDMSHQEIMDVYAQHIQHQKFGEVIAQNLATRNALKAHPAIAVAQVKPVNGVAEVAVFGYRHGMSQDQITDMGRQIVEGKKVDGVQVTQELGEDSLEEVQAAVETESDDSETGGSSPAAAEPTADRMPAIKELAKEKGADLAAMCKNLFDSRPDNLTSEQQTKLMGILEKVQPSVKGAPKEVKS